MVQKKTGPGERLTAGRETTADKKPYFERTMFGYRVQITPVAKEETSVRIAVVLMHQSNMWTRRVAKGFVASLCNGMEQSAQIPLIDVFSAEGSRAYLRDTIMTQIENRLDEYAMVVTIGLWPSQEVKSYLREHQITLPQLFLGVEDPIGGGLVRDWDALGENISGVSGLSHDYRRQVDIYKSVRSNFKKVLIPIDRSFANLQFSKEYSDLVQYLEGSGVSVVQLDIDNEKPFIEQIEAKIDGVDTIIAMRDVTVQAYGKELINLCDSKDITLFASDLAMVFQGAAVGFGDAGTVFGVHGARLAREVLQDKRESKLGSAKQLAVYQLDQQAVLRVNPKNIGKQGLHLSDSQIDLIKSVIPLGWE